MAVQTCYFLRDTRCALRELLYECVTQISGIMPTITGVFVNAITGQFVQVAFRWLFLDSSFPGFEEDILPHGGATSDGPGPRRARPMPGPMPDSSPHVPSCNTMVANVLMWPVYAYAVRALRARN